jgi:hypothetical protein
VAHKTVRTIDHEYPGSIQRAIAKMCAGCFGRAIYPEGCVRLWPMLSKNDFERVL